MYGWQKRQLKKDEMIMVRAVSIITDTRRLELDAAGLPRKAKTPSLSLSKRLIACEGLDGLRMIFLSSEIKIVFN